MMIHHSVSLTDFPILIDLLMAGQLLFFSQGMHHLFSLSLTCPLPCLF